MKKLFKGAARVEAYAIDGSGSTSRYPLFSKNGEVSVYVDGNLFFVYDGEEQELLAILANVSFILKPQK